MSDTSVVIVFNIVVFVFVRFVVIVGLLRRHTRYREAGSCLVFVCIRCMHAGPGVSDLLVVGLATHQPCSPCTAAVVANLSSQYDAECCFLLE
jgi:hypothetical protein